MKTNWLDWESMKKLGIRNLQTISSKISKDNFGSFWLWDEVDAQALGPFTSFEDAVKEGEKYYESL